MSRTLPLAAAARAQQVKTSHPGSKSHPGSERNPEKFSTRLAGLTVLLAILLAAACSNSKPPISVAVSASSAQTDQGQSVTVTAMITNDSSGRGVSWSVNGAGSLQGSGSSITYVAPAPSNNSAVQTATVSATSVADPTKTASMQISVNPLPFINALSLPNANAGAAYSQSVSEVGGTAPFTWAIVNGALPSGLNIGAGSGTISGSPTNGGTWYFDVQLKDAAGVIAEQPFLSIEVFANSAAGNPVPFVNNPLVPAAVAPGGAGFMLTVNGTGFLSTSIVDFNGAALATTFVNNKQLAATVPAADIATAATAAITVVNPSPGGGRSNAVFFPVATPEANVSLSNGNGSPITTIYGPISAVVGDFTGNGKPDLAVAQFGDRAYIFLANGDGTFNPAPGSPMIMQQPPWDTLPTPYPDFVAVGDFNNSGKLGVAVAARRMRTLRSCWAMGTEHSRPRMHTCTRRANLCRRLRSRIFWGMETSTWRSRTRLTA